MIPLYHRDRGNRADPYTEPNSCFSDSSDSLNSLNSVNVLLHLEKTPLTSHAIHTNFKSDVRSSLGSFSQFPFVHINQICIIQTTIVIYPNEVSTACIKSSMHNNTHHTIHCLNLSNNNLSAVCNVCFEIAS